MSKQRNFAIDATKAFGIFAVVVAHNDYTLLGSYLYSFHIPIFFFISGLLYNEDKYNNFTVLLKKRFVSLMIPYFSVSILLFLFWFIIGRKFGASAELNLSVFKNFLGIFYAQGGIEYMDWGVPMWFLPALFLTSLVYYFISKLKLEIRILLLIISGFIAYVFSELLSFRLIWSFDIVFTALIFYGTGNVLRKSIFSEIIAVNHSPKKLLITGIALILNVTFFILNDKIDISKAVYHNYFFMYLSGVGGSVFYLSLFSYLPYNKFIAFTGQNSLLIMGFHLRAMTFIKAFQIYVLGIAFFMNTTTSIIYATIQVVLLVPVILLVRKYFPFMAGLGFPRKNT